ncbi:MAG: PQQ-dependent sugar dehydrogenase [Halioglobus sp.]|nr:PQQ-dependent sugar dehydrogenase [Halioglobus sp.]
MPKKKFALLVLAALITGCDALQYGALKTYMAVEKGLEVDEGAVLAQSASQDFQIQALTNELEFPWGMDFLPDGRLLITERPGRLQILDLNSHRLTPVQGVPPVHYKGQGGLLDVAVHPRFADTGWIYLSAAVALNDGLSTTRVLRFRLDGDRLTDAATILEARPAFDSNTHFGSALLFDNAGRLFVTVGDRRQRDLAQDLGTHMGKVLRLREDGGVPDDNPFVGSPGALPEIYSYGHRNPQGIAIDRASGHLWVAEHGPQGGDEINRLTPGTNYGWPVITYGEEYGGGKIGEGTQREGMAQPEYYYVPSIATAGLAFYSGDALPGWRGSLFVAGLRSFSVSRVTPDAEGKVAEERLLEDFSFRARSLKQGPDELLYLLTENGGVLRIGPAE